MSRRHTLGAARRSRLPLCTLSSCRVLVADCLFLRLHENFDSSRAARAVRNSFPVPGYSEQQLPSTLTGRCNVPFCASASAFATREGEAQRWRHSQSSVLCYFICRASPARTEFEMTQIPYALAAGTFGRACRQPAVARHRPFRTFSQQQTERELTSSSGARPAVPAAHRVAVRRVPRRLVAVDEGHRRVLRARVVGSIRRRRHPRTAAAARPGLAQAAPARPARGGPQRHLRPHGVSALVAAAAPTAAEERSRAAGAALHGSPPVFPPPLPLPAGAGPERRGHGEAEAPIRDVHGDLRASSRAREEQAHGGSPRCVF